MSTPDAALFAALSDPTRLQLLDRLRAEPGQSTSALTEGSGVTRQAVTKHLAVLAEAGLVRDVKQGRERVWEVDTTPLAAITAWVSGFTPTVATTPPPEAEAQPEAAAPPAPEATTASEPVHASPGVAGTEASAFTAPRKPAARPGQVRRWRVPR
jgi:DNA-binding transcriptional ArsR family regulator